VIDLFNCAPFGIENEPKPGCLRIVMPSYTGVPTEKCSELIMALQAQGCSITKIVHSSNIEHARTRALAAAMQDACASEFLLLDDDIFVDPDIVARLRAFNRPFVAVLGSTKWPPYSITIKPEPGAETVDGLLRVRAGALQCALVRRECIEKAWHAYPERRCRLGQVPMLALFDSPILDGELYSEDMAFCLRLREIGYPMEVMTDADVQHGSVRVNMARGTVERLSDSAGIP
jgi:hypothetical protein